MTISKKPNGQFGFTLIEILIVMTIIGIMTAMVSLSITPDHHRQMRDEAYRFARVLEQAVDAAEMGDPLGLVWTPTGYGFRRLDEQGHWQVTGEAFFADRVWPEGVYAQPLVNGGRPLLLWQQGQSHPLALILTDNQQHITLHLTPLGRVIVGEKDT